MLQEGKALLKIEKIEERNLKGIPGPCKYCLYWQTSAPFDEKLLKPEMESEKREWFSKVIREFGSCGFIAHFSGVPIGFIQYAPAKFLSTDKGIYFWASKQRRCVPCVSLHSE